MASNYQDSSSDTTDLDMEYTQNEKELLDYVLEKYRQGVFELFNIIASKSYSWTRGLWRKSNQRLFGRIWQSDRRKTKEKVRSLKVKLQ